MSISLKKISKLIDLDLSDIPKEKRKTVKKEIGDFVVEEILIAVSKGQSPVIGEKRNFKKLKPDYAKAEKGGDRNPDLELLGDMLDSLTFKNTTKGIEVGIFKATEVPKADGHNNFSGKSTLPKRRFIPKDSQKFRKSIQNGVKGIINEFKADAVIPLTLEDVFNDKSLELFLAQEGGNTRWLKRPESK